MKDIADERHALALLRSWDSNPEYQELLNAVEAGVVFLHDELTRCEGALRELAEAHAALEAECEEHDLYHICRPVPE